MATIDEDATNGADNDDDEIVKDSLHDSVTKQSFTARITYHRNKKLNSKVITKMTFLKKSEFHHEYNTYQFT